MAKNRLLKKKIRKLHREGDLGKIVKYYLNPLLKYRPKGMEIRDWIDILFGAKYRTIDTYEVGKQTKVKGTAITRYGAKAENFGQRTVFPGDLLYVRMDSRTPNLIDIEVVSSYTSRVYRLNALQWERLSKSLRLKNDSDEE